jgi:hypothetical protein
MVSRQPGRDLGAPEVVVGRREFDLRAMIADFTTTPRVSKAIWLRLPFGSVTSHAVSRR